MRIPIIILHGWGANSSAWQTPKKLLEKMGFSVFIPDLPGFGKSLSPKTAWSVSDYVDFVVRFAKEKKLEKFILIGHSFGGRIAIKLAADYPENLSGLVLIGVPLKSKKTPKVLLFALLSKVGKVVFLIPPFSFFAPLARKCLYHLIGEWDYYKTSGIMKETFKKIISEDLTASLGKISLSTLVLWGKNDNVTPVSLAYFIKEKIPLVHLLVLPGATHKLPYEQPEIFVKEVVEFLNNL